MIGFAHRGAPAPHQRENALPAFRRALAAGANGLESDIWLTADGVPVLRHNAALGPRRRLVAGLRRAELPPWLPSLADLYEQAGWDFDLSLDLKGHPAGMSGSDAAKAVLAVARASGGSAAVGRLWLCGPLSALRIWRELDSDVKLVNSTSAAEVTAHGGGAACARLLRTAGVDALNLRAREWIPARAGIVADLHAAGLVAFGWDAQSTAMLRRLRGYQLDGLYSDHLHRLVAVTVGRAPDPRPGDARHGRTGR